jgi:signal transduction histidine kinase
MSESVNAQAPGGPLDSALFALAFDAFDQPLALLDPSLSVIAANRPARDLLPGLRAGNAAPLCCQLLYGSDRVCPDPSDACALRRAARAGQPARLTHQHRVGDGEPRVAEVTAIPLFSSAGQLAGVLQLVRDVTESTLTKEAISRARNEWLATADSVPDLIFLTDLASAIIRCNRAAMRFLATPYRDLIGRPLRAAFRRVAPDTSPLEQERAELKCERPRAILEVAQYAAHLDGKPYGTVWVMRDVTAVRRLESIAASVDMTSNLGHVLGTVRHELGNPINAIKTALAVLQERFDTFPDAKKRTYLGRCLDDIERVQSLLDNLRTFNMFEAVHCESVDLVAYLRRLAGLVREQLDAQDIAFDVKLPAAATTLPVHADPRALQQVLLGLIANAVDAVRGRRRPKISMETVAESDEVRIALVDNGTGIRPEDRSMVFLPLFTTKPHGTGLGLAIARNFIARMDGTVELESKFGRGTRVELTLRRVPAAAPLP